MSTIIRNLKMKYYEAKICRCRTKAEVSAGKKTDYWFRKFRDYSFKLAML